MGNGGYHDDEKESHHFPHKTSTIRNKNPNLQVRATASVVCAKIIESWRPGAAGGRSRWGVVAVSKHGRIALVRLPCSKIRNIFAPLAALGGGGLKGRPLWQASAFSFQPTKGKGLIVELP